MAAGANLSWNWKMPRGRVRVDDQLGSLDAAVQVLGEDRGHHAVVVAVGDQGRVGELRQVIGRAAAPLLDRLQLRPERLDLDRRIAVDSAFLESLHERLRRGLAGGVAVEEQELLWVGAGHGRSQHVPVGGAGDLVDVVAAFGAGAREDKLADELGMLDDEGLGDETTEGECEDVDLIEPEGLDERVGVVGHRLDAVGTCPVDAPTPLLSKATTFRFFAMGSTMGGSQLSSVAARCTKNTTGMPPFGPSSRYA